MGGGVQESGLEKREKVTTGGKNKSEVKQVTGMAADTPLMIVWENDMEHLVDGELQLEKWLYCCRLVDMMQLWCRSQHVCYH